MFEKKREFQCYNLIVIPFSCDFWLLQKGTIGIRNVTSFFFFRTVIRFQELLNQESAEMYNESNGGINLTKIYNSQDMIITHEFVSEYSEKLKFLEHGSFFYY